MITQIKVNDSRGAPVQRPGFRTLAAFCTITCVTCLALLGTLQSWASESKPGKLYAVIVGIKQFQDKKIPPLTISDKDAADFHKFLKVRGQYFSGTQISLLLNEQATRANVSKALRTDLRKAEKDDFVIIYLSGPGCLPVGRALATVPVLP